jgi:hypothetical protein
VRLRREVELARLAARRTSTLSAALFPTGTLRAAGSAAGAAPRADDSTESSWNPSCLICCAARGWLPERRGVLPCRFARAISSPDVFCSRFSPSSSGMSAARAVSSVAMSSSALSGSRPRLRRPVRTSSM